jgi:hypothetical protein
MLSCQVSSNKQEDLMLRKGGGVTMKEGKDLRVKEDKDWTVLGNKERIPPH